MPAPPTASEFLTRVPGAWYQRLVIDGVALTAVDSDDLPFGNACNNCWFRGSCKGGVSGVECYTRTDFSCHSDSREDERDVVFLIDNA